LGRIYTHISITHPTSHIPFVKICNNILQALHSETENVTNIKIAIAIISCIIKKPIAIFPYRLSISHLSDTSFIITIVLLNVIAIAINIDVILSNPSNQQIQNPIIDVKTTCHIPVIVATLPTSLIILGLSHSQTINKRITTHI
jgi:hypothetical protein